MNSQPRVCCYLRVSTDDQNVDSQEAQLREYCQRRGWQRVGFFVDHGSGAKRDRGALNVMMDEVREGTVDVVLTWKIDRLARSLNHLAQIISEFQTHKVALVCPSQGIDTTDSNPCAEFQLNILAAVAQFERELIVERVNAGIAAARARGVKLGRPRKKEKYVDQIISLMDEGCNAAQISRQLKIPYSTVSEIVRGLKTSHRNGV
jgi:putative DNA-invertase from lambdoid prophage Rac